MTMKYCLNPLEGKGNYSAASNNMKLLHCRWWVGCYIWYSEEGHGRASPINGQCTNHHCPLFCCFKGL